MTKNTKKTVLISTLIVVIMFGFSFALAPLYNTFCKVTGINQLPTEKEFNESKNSTREITVQLTTTNNKDVNVEFYPLKTSVVVHPGENTQLFFFVWNNTKHRMKVQAVPSILPTSAIAHFHKIQCFCFQQQSLRPDEEKHMPLVFRIDKDLPSDVKTITLSYTLFDVTSQQKKGTT